MSHRQPDHGATGAELAAVAVLFVAISAWTGWTQRTERLFGDAQRYHDIAQQFTAGSFPISSEAPFVFRIGTPWLASAIRPAVERVMPKRVDLAIERAAGLKGVAPFYVVNVAAAFSAAVLLWLYLRRFVATSGLRVLLVGCWMAMWHGPVRFVYFYPVNVDALFVAMLFAALLVIEATESWPAAAAALVVAPVVFAGTIVRETMALAALAFIVRRARATNSGASARWWLAAPAAAWLLAIGFVRVAAVPDVPYVPWSEPLNMLRQKPVFTWVLAWFYTFGLPAIALVAAAPREVWALVRAQPHLGVHIAACGALAFFGGTDTERILAWSAPAIYVLVGAAIAARADVLRRTPALVAILCLVQLASTRLLWPIPVGVEHASRAADLEFSWASIGALADKFLVIRNYYSNLWSFFGSRTIHLIALVIDLSTAGLLALWIERRRLVLASAHLA